MGYPYPGRVKIGDDNNMKIKAKILAAILTVTGVAGLLVNKGVALLATADFSGMTSMIIDILPIILLISIFGFIIKKFKDIGG